MNISRAALVQGRYSTLTEAVRSRTPTCRKDSSRDNRRVPSAPEHKPASEYEQVVLFTRATAGLLLSHPGAKGSTHVNLSEVHGALELISSSIWGRRPIHNLVLRIFDSETVKLAQDQNLRRCLPTLLKKLVKVSSGSETGFLQTSAEGQSHSAPRNQRGVVWRRHGDSCRRMTHRQIMHAAVR